VQDICRDDDWRENLYYMCIFKDIKIAKSYISLLDDLEEYTRNNSRSPDWGHIYFIQKYNEECFIIKEIDDDEEEDDGDHVPDIYYNKHECNKRIRELYTKKEYQKYTLKYKAIGPFRIEDHISKDECDVYDGVVSDDDDNNDSDEDYEEEDDDKYAIESKSRFNKVLKRATTLREENEIFI
jgi:hypothetical protein